MEKIKHLDTCGNSLLQISDLSNSQMVLFFSYFEGQGDKSVKTEEG